MSDDDDDTAPDTFCGRCGQALPDAFDQSVTEAIARHRRALTTLTAVKTREHFAAVGVLRGQKGLTHPRVRRVYGRELQPGWLVRTTYQSTFGETTIWNVIVELDDRVVYILGLDPSHGNVGGSHGRDGVHWIDDLEIDEKNPYDPWSQQ
jgi:hypothetical protein